jgi:hypothetical protein
MVRSRAQEDTDRTREFPRIGVQGLEERPIVALAEVAKFMGSGQPRGATAVGGRVFRGASKVATTAGSPDRRENGGRSI